MTGMALGMASPKFEPSPTAVMPSLYNPYRKPTTTAEEILDFVTLLLL